MSVETGSGIRYGDEKLLTSLMCNEKRDEMGFL
jgi:hypothetical protein